jgi:hypothetical protein
MNPAEHTVERTKQGPWANDPVRPPTSRPGGAAKNNGAVPGHAITGLLEATGMCFARRAFRMLRFDRSNEAATLCQLCAWAQYLPVRRGFAVMAPPRMASPRVVELRHKLMRLLDIRRNRHSQRGHPPRRAESRQRNGRAAA